MQRVIFLLAFCFSGTILAAQNGWVLATHKQAIEVFVKCEPGSKVKSLKVQCELDATISQVVALLLDIPATKSWMPNTKTCFITRQISPGDIYYYTEVNLPWPLNNRDFVTHLRVSADPATGVVTIDAPAVPGSIAPKKGIVRIPQSLSRWILKPGFNNHIQLEYYLLVDPGGLIPASLVNYFATDAAIDAIKNMQGLLLSSKYPNTETSFVVSQKLK